MNQPDNEVVLKIAAEARRRQGAAREAFLDDTCGTDQVLRKLVEEKIRPKPAGTLVPAQVDLDATFAAPPASKHSLHPRQGLTTRYLPGTSLLVQVWASRLYRTIAIVSFVVLIILLGIGARYLVWNELSKVRQQEFTALLAADVQALTSWIETRKEHVSVVAKDQDVREAILSLVQEKRTLGDDYSASAVQEELAFFRQRFPKFTRSEDEAKRFIEENEPIAFDGHGDPLAVPPGLLPDEGIYFVANAAGVILASTEENAINQTLAGTRRLQVFSDVFQNKAGFIPPMRPDHEMTIPGTRPSVAFTWVYQPIYDDSNLPSALLCFGYYSVGNFTKSLINARTGQTGEAYAFDANGLMLTESRFTKDLWRMGILPEGEPSRANLMLRPPFAMQHPNPENHHRFTRLIAEALADHKSGPKSAVMMEPYLNYRGHYVVGAWQWIDEYNFGVAYETESQEAFRPFTYISFSQYALLFLIAGFAGLAYYAASSLVQMRRTIGENMIVGAYELIRKIGEGGMGQVYLARHQMLKRPTAVKLMRPEQTDPALIKRFEREVQLSSRLKHPNTVEIYDYGKTPDDIFYYAMEYLDGITIEVLVRQYGWQPISRTLWVMRQVAASLREAHESGLIHRDIKPLNIMLCRVGGEYDVAKVLDFGLVKNLSADPGATIVTNTTEISGTPMYIPPERVKNPTQADPRVDIYALGATAFFMLTGQTIFNAASAVDVLVQIVTQSIPSVKDASDRVIPDALQDLISRCLAKDPKDRPQTADEVLKEIEKLMDDFPWTQQDAADWWNNNIPVDELIELAILEPEQRPNA
ncbi:Serine/threonine-protein kinase PrkC [Bremerella volcania]|uniref:Serine/threonine-protein kinase PrkC n=1 Tax=Bremerella volcania TaxID=2527984 RepID=A0A518C2T8_9BACT|nr:serine/threonine-protein kinase [Bremerella volcania]QDU73547.1 Serine/threonine-protein kinase PrkC [Bremerella volcania]